MRCSDSSPLVPPCSVSFARRYQCLSALEDVEVSQVPGEPTRAYAALLDPGRTFTPSHEDDRRCGESLFPAAFACGSSPLPVPHSAHERCLAASRRIGSAPESLYAKGSGRSYLISGLIRAA